MKLKGQRRSRSSTTGSSTSETTGQQEQQQPSESVPGRVGTTTGKATKNEKGSMASTAHSSEDNNQDLNDQKDDLNGCGASSAEQEEAENDCDTESCSPHAAENRMTENSSSFFSLNKSKTKFSFLPTTTTTATATRGAVVERARRAKRNWNSTKCRTRVVVLLILLVGILASGAIMVFDIPAAKREAQGRFNELALELLQTFDTVLQDYNTAGLWIHEACHTFKVFNSSSESYVTRVATPSDFRVLYDYLRASGLEFQAIYFTQNVTHDQRAAKEATTRAYLRQQWPQVQYQGIMGFQPDPLTGNLSLAPRPEQPFYFPIRMIQPMEDFKNRAAIDFDLWSSPTRLSALREAISTGLPTMTEPLKLIEETVEGTEASAYSVIRMHPGIKLSNLPYKVPNEIASIAIRIPEFLQRVNRIAYVQGAMSVYIFDTTHSSNATTTTYNDDDDKASFLGSARMFSRSKIDPEKSIEFLPKIGLSEVRQQGKHFALEREISVASRKWTFVMMAPRSAYKTNVGLIVFSGLSMFVACLLLALWVYTSSRRVARMQQIKMKAAADRAETKVGTARQAAKRERELNDFIAHEVRNPLSAAISACSFVSASVNEAQPLVDDESRISVREDVGIITNSLHFINDLLRNMLDMHRASSNEMKLSLSQVHLLSDVMQPVASMLYQRGENFEIIIDCPKHLVVVTDVIRLKQIFLNLGRNSVKFVTQGFVRLRAAVINDSVHLFVEDSGPGIPATKQLHLFQKFQESLDALNQGTGIGLALCKNIVKLMQGEIYLDGEYDSGVPGMPGARFVIDMKQPPSHVDSFTDSLEDDNDADNEGMEAASRDGAVKTSDGNSPTEKNAHSEQHHFPELPTGMSILFVDDAFVLRKLFSRAVAKVTTDWTIEEAANGETCIRLVEDKRYDVIFVDQYMASTEKQLLGTEAIRILRSNGCDSIIVGLSANDLEKSFLAAGADAFMMKPFPCEKGELMRELHRVLTINDDAAEESNRNNNNDSSVVQPDTLVVPKEENSD